jgi:hypothetical protein
MDGSSLKITLNCIKYIYNNYGGIYICIVVLPISQGVKEINARRNKITA